MHSHPIPADEFCRPNPDEPGSLFEQVAAISVYLHHPLRELDRDIAWQDARERAIPHAGNTELRGGKS